MFVLMILIETLMFNPNKYTGLVPKIFIDNLMFFKNEQFKIGIRTISDNILETFCK